MSRRCFALFIWKRNTARRMSHVSLRQASRNSLLRSPHYIWPIDGQAFGPRFLAILHYKFTEQFVSKIEDALKNEQYWDKSIEYRGYQRVLKTTERLLFEFEKSLTLANSNMLAELGLIKKLEWPRMLESNGPA